MRRTEAHQGVRMIKFVSIWIAKQTAGHRSFEIACVLGASRAAGLLYDKKAPQRKWEDVFVGQAALRSPAT